MGWSWWALGNRPAFFVVVMFLVGVSVGPVWETGPHEHPFLLAVTCAAALVVAFIGASRVGALLLVLLAAFGVGMLVSTLAANAEVPPLEARHLQLEGEVEAVNQLDEGARLVLAVSLVDGAPAKFRASLFTRDHVEVLPGARVMVSTSRLKPLTPQSNPGEWNRVPMLARRAQRFSGGFDGARLLVLRPAPAWRHWLDHTQHQLEQQVRALAPDQASASLFLTLAAGLRAELDDDIEDEFARSGLAHVLSVSGLHVAALAFAVFGALRRLLCLVPGRFFHRVDPRRVAAPLAIPLVWAYVVFTGVQAPAVRSAVMCSLLLAGHLVMRRSDALNALALSALVMTTLDPSALLDLSVQLSFCAVLSLILLTPVVRQSIPLAPPSPATQTGLRLRVARVRETVLQTFAASLAVTVAGAPLVLSTFQRIGIAGLVSNVVCLPLCAALTLFAAGGAGLFVIAPWLSTPVLWAGAWLSKLLLWFAHLFAAMPGAAMRLPGPAWWLTCAWWLGLAVFALAKGRLRWLALLTPLAGLVHAWPTSAPTVDVTFLAVGHGDAIVVDARGHRALIDGGGVPDGTDTGRRFVVPFLRSRRISSLDLAVLSHAHPDHALGLAATLREVPTSRLWVPAGSEGGELVDDLLDAAEEATVEHLEVGHPGLQLGPVRVEVLGPPVDRLLLKHENDRSLVLRLTHGEVTFLLPGDVEEAGEELLTPGQVTVLKAPHHGSRTSSTPGFIEQARPRHVVFCVGRANRFGFPHDGVVERYRALGARCYRTDLDGAVTFHSDGHDVTVETFLDEGVTSFR